MVQTVSSTDVSEEWKAEGEDFIGVRYCIGNRHEIMRSQGWLQGLNS